MAYQSKVQVIQRGGTNRQYYLICPAPLAQALEIEKGEVIEWVVEDKHTLILRRSLSRPMAALSRRRQHA
jgi:bifunctional DNA-binding transcriptional regulator/antitoxin component of YhaV-PrlF toxin-antitoxin module